MTIKIDRAGRDLDMEVSTEGILLRPAGHKPSLVKKGSFLVHTGKVPAGYDILKADHEDRIRKVSGL